MKRETRQAKRDRIWREEWRDAVGRGDLRWQDTLLRIARRLRIRTGR